MLIMIIMIVMIVHANYDNYDRDDYVSRDNYNFVDDNYDEEE